MSAVETLRHEPDLSHIERFAGAMFRHASSGTYASVRAFEEGQTKPFRISPVRLNGSLRSLIETAYDDAIRAAGNPKPVVFCPPIATFSDSYHAREQDLAEGLALSVECDVRPQAARQRLEELLGPATVVVESGGTWIDPGTGEVEAKLHLHWRLAKPATGEHLRALKEARRLATRLVGGDPSNVPAVHPIRWPGSWHRKGEPKLCRIVHEEADREVQLEEVLERLRDVVPIASPSIASGNQPFGDDRDLTSLIAGVVSGESYHPSLVPLAARLLGSGMYPGAAVNMLRALMEAAPGASGDIRWQARYNDIPRIVETASAKWGANEPGTGEDDDRPTVSTVAADVFNGWPVPTRRFLLNGSTLIPARNVTLLTGDGGTGKSLLSLQLAVAVAADVHWLGIPTFPGPVLYLSAEDELDEVHRRLVDIVTHHGKELADLGKLHILPLAGEDAILAAPLARSNIIETTALWRQVVGLVETHKPALVVFDTLADLFAGEENQRAQARQFISLLRGLALKHDTTVVVLAHPSLSGMASGTGSSGSTGWSNSVRSRLYLARALDEDRNEPDVDLRVLKSTKSNYGRAGDEIRVRWTCGVFVPEGKTTPSGLDRLAADQMAEQVFLNCLRLTLAQGRHTSPAKCSTYAPACFSRMPEAKGFRANVLALAMERLLSAGKLRVETEGPPSKLRRFLTFADHQQEEAA